MREAGIAYVFLSKELGARSEDPSCYQSGSVKYNRLAKTELFQSGLDRVERGLQSHTLALLCAEKEPLHCHRTLLVARQLEESRDVRVQHILEDGRVEPRADTVRRLLQQLHQPEMDLFRSREQIVAEAYETSSSEGTSSDREPSKMLWLPKRNLIKAPSDAGPRR